MRLPKPNSLPSKFKFERHPAVAAQSYKQTSQRFHNNLKTQPGRWMGLRRCRARGACAGRCHRSVGIFPPLTDVDDWILQIVHHASRHVRLHVLWQAAVCLRRIMHWARRIEQEIDRVFQHITGAQQLKGVSASLCFLEISLMSAPDQPIKTRTGHKASGTSAKPRSRRAQIGARCEKQLVYVRTSWQTVFPRQIENKHTHQHLLYEFFLARLIWCRSQIFLAACILFAIISLSKTDAWTNAGTDLEYPILCVLEPKFSSALTHSTPAGTLSIDQRDLQHSSNPS